MPGTASTANIRRLGCITPGSRAGYRRGHDSRNGVANSALSARVADTLKRQALKENKKRQASNAIELGESLTPQDPADVKRWAADAVCEVTFQRVKTTAHARVAATRGSRTPDRRRTKFKKASSLWSSVPRRLNCASGRNMATSPFWLPMCESL